MLHFTQHGTSRAATARDPRRPGARVRLHRRRRAGARAGGADGWTVVSVKDDRAPPPHPPPSRCHTSTCTRRTSSRRAAGRRPARPTATSGYGAPRGPADVGDDAAHRMVRLSGRPLVRRAVPELRACVDDAHQGPAAGDGRRAAADRRPGAVQRLAATPARAGTGSSPRSTAAASGRTSCRPSEAWTAQRPFTSTAPVPGPLYLPEYWLPESARAAALNASADALYAAGTTAKDDGDSYVLSTLFFAAVLFLAGISLRTRLAAAAPRRPRDGGRGAARRASATS